MSKCRTQINAQCSVYEKTGRMIKEQAITSGLVIPREIEEEKEHECKQVAFGFKGTSIGEKELDAALNDLSKAIKKTMMDKGLVN